MVDRGVVWCLDLLILQDATIPQQDSNSVGRDIRFVRNEGDAGLAIIVSQESLRPRSGANGRRRLLGLG
jgi:hypothetical protein